LSSEKAYDNGYRLQPDRKQKFNYNQDVDKVLNMEPEKVITFFNKLYKEYDGMYELFVKK